MQTGAFGVTPPARYPDFFAPGGRLTLASGTPVVTSDQSAKTVVYYTHDCHAYFPVVKNGIVKPVYFPDELSLTLSDAHLANTIYDVFGVERNGRGRIVTGPAWSNSAVGSGSRGTGGGSTELARAAGILVNRWGIPGLSAEGSTYIPPLEGTYLGSLFVDGSAGQVTCHVSYGQNRKWGVWNLYNQRQIVMRAGDSDASVMLTNQTSTGPRASLNDSNNKLTTLCGIQQMVKVSFLQRVRNQGGANTMAAIGIGLNTSTAFSGTIDSFTTGSENLIEHNLKAEYETIPTIGINNFFGVEQQSASTNNTVIYFGTEASMKLSAEYLG